MAANTVVFSYNINVDADAGTFEMVVVGGEHDGTVVCTGEQRMAGALLGMMRLAAYTHAIVRNDHELVEKIITGEVTASESDWMRHGRNSKQLYIPGKDGK